MYSTQVPSELMLTWVHVQKRGRQEMEVPQCLPHIFPSGHSIMVHLCHEQAPIVCMMASPTPSRGTHIQWQCPKGLLLLPIPSAPTSLEDSHCLRGGGMLDLFRRPSCLSVVCVAGRVCVCMLFIPSQE